MASSFESIDKMPVWQRLVLWLVMAAAIAAGWYFVFYVEAVEAHAAAESGLSKAQTELDRLEEKKKNYLEELRQHEERKAQLKEGLESLPMSSTTIDNMMQVFQQKARQEGVSFDSWTNGGEERQDVYVRLPVEVKARGSWSQVANFFRQISALDQPVSIENLRLDATTTKGDEDSDHPPLDVEFEAATYRALSPEERAAPTAAQGSRREPSRRKKGKAQ